MTILYINTGSNANSGDGDSLRSAFNKVNQNFEILSGGIAGFGYTGSASPGYTGSRGAGYTGSIGYTGSASTSTSWDLTSQGNGCPINVTLTTTTFDVQVPRNHLFFRDDGSWDIGSYFNTNYITGDISGGNGIALTTDRGTVFFGNSPEICGPTAASHFHIMRDDPATVDLFFGDDYNYVKLPYTSTLTNVGVEIGTDATNLWSFGKDGVLTMPDGNNGSDGRIAFNFEGYNWGNIRSHNRQVYIESGEGTTSTYSQIAVGVDIGLSSIENITLRTATTDAGDLYDDGTGHNPSFNTWTFGTDGNLNIPGDIQDDNGSLIFVATTSTAPTRVDGLVWFNTVDGRAYIKYENNWVDLSPPLVPPVSTYLDGLIVDGTTISTVDSTATMYMGGDLLPEYNNMYDLGSAERQWKSLYVSTGTIYIGGTPLSVSANGTLLVDGMPIVAAANAGDRITSGTSSVIVYGDGTVTLPGDIVVGDNNGHIYIDDDLGGASSIRWVNLNPSSAMLRVWSDGRNDLNNQRLELGYDIEGGLYITTTQNVDGLYNNPGDDFNWTFGADGGLHFPDGSKQTTAYLGVDNNRWLDYLQANTGGYSYVLGVSSVQHDSQNAIVASVHHEAYGPNYTGIVKVDSAGATVWERIYSTSTSVDGWGVAVDSHDDIYVAGHVYGSGVWLAKLDSSTGENIWQTGLDGLEGYVVDVGSDDCPVIVGVDSYTNHDMFVAKFSSTGTILWQHQLGDSVYDDDAWGMAVGPSNEIIVVGTTNHDGGSGSNLLLVAKYDVSGILQWQKEIYDSNWSGWNANGADAVVDPSGNIYVLFSQDSIFGASAILIRMSPNGETVDWNLTLSAECVDQYTAALDIDTDGNVYLNSTTVDTNGVNIVYNTFVSSVSSEGSIRWQRGLRRQITDQSTSSATVVWPGAVIDTFGTTINGSSLSVKDGKIAIGGGSVNLAGGNGLNPDINTALGYILQTTTDGDVFARGEWELFNTYFDVDSTTLTVNTGTCSTDTRVMNVISIDVPSVADDDSLNIQRLREPVERIGVGASFEYSTLQEGLFDGPGAGGVTSITGKHDLNTGVSLTSETWAQLMWVPDTSVVTINDISDGPDVYNWAYAGPNGFQIKNATTGTSHEWLFSSTGTLILPQGSVIGETTGTAFISPPGAQTGQSLAIRPTNGTTETSHIHLVSGNPAIVDLYLGDDDQYVKIEKNAGNVVVGTNLDTNHWTFGTDGELTLPTGGRLGAIDPKGGTMLDGGLGSNVSVTSFYSTGNYSSCVTASAGGTLYITAYNDGGPNPSRQWVFDKDGSLTLPEGGVIKTSTGTNILDGLGGGAANIGNYTFDNDNLNMPLESKLNSGGVGVANSAEFGTSVTVSTSTVVNSEIYMGSGYGEFRSIYNKVGEIESGLTYAGVEGFNYAQYGDVNFSGMVSQTPHIDSMYTISVSTTTGLISIGFTQDGGTSVSKDWITVLGTLNAYYTVNGIFADTTQTVISGGDGVLSSIVKLTDSASITTIDSITTGTNTWIFGTDGVLTLSTASTILGSGTDPNVYIETATTATTSTWTFGIDGNLTLPEGGTIKGGGTGTDVTVVASTGTNNKIWTFGANGGLTFPDTTVQTTAYVASSVVNRTTGSWTLATGANTVSITVPVNSNYTMWVNGNIPNGIVNWNATVNVSNTNVPVIGSQYAWYYVDGNALVLTSIPDQIVGTAGVISTSSSYVGSTANVFTFGITNNSTSTQMINWGYTTL